MTLYIIRHGSAENNHPDGDSARSLTSEGEQKVDKMAGFLKGKMKPDVILSSPYKRALQTAERFAGILGLGYENLIITESLHPGSDPTDIIQDVSTRGYETVAVVGHNPLLSELCADLLGRDCSGIDLKKAAVARLDFDGPVRKEEGTLLWLVTTGVIY